MQNSPTDGPSPPIVTGSPATEDEPDAEHFVIPALEETHPMLAEPFLPSARERDKQRGERSLGDHLAIPRARAALKKSLSDRTLRAGSRPRGSTSDSTQTTIHVNGLTREKSGSEPNPTDGASLQPAQHPLRRTASNSGLELRSRYHDPTIDSATLQQQLNLRIQHTSQTQVNPWRVKRIRTTYGPFHWADRRAPKPGFMWFPVRSKSDPVSIRQGPHKPHKSETNFSLKSSMKQKSKSAAATPSSGTATDTSTPSDGQQLRRTKTVDFEENASKSILPPLPALQSWVSELTDATETGLRRSGSWVAKENRHKPDTPKRTASCLGPEVKSRLADPALTRTDVHVVAITPRWSADDLEDDGNMETTTPTMQIVESRNGCYEIIWDDVPAEYDIRLRLRSSAASQALQTVGSTATQGLECVNSKLTEWTGDRGSQPEPFRPKNVVFPDDDSRSLQLKCREYNDEDVVMPVPPNSAKTSAAPSHASSHATSSRPSRTASHDGAHPKLVMEKLRLLGDDDAGTQVEVPTLVVPDPEAPLLVPTGVFRKMKQPPAMRRLSNMEESDMKFRNHRDSLTLARSRIFNAGGVSPELFRHRDSIAMAKRRMHARNHAISGAREIHDTSGSAVNGTKQSSQLQTPSTIKQAAANALKRKGSAPMLLPQPTVVPQHIRIIE